MMERGGSDTSCWTRAFESCQEFLNEKTELVKEESIVSQLKECIVASKTLVETGEDFITTLDSGVVTLLKSTTNSSSSAFVPELLRLLRNLCIHKQVQELMLKRGVLEHVLTLVNDMMLQEDLDDSTIIRVAVQFLGNAVTSNGCNQAHLWKLAFPSTFQHLFVFAVNDRKLLSYAAMALHNCIINNSSRISDVVSNRPLLATLLERCIISTYNSGGSDDPYFEWACLIFNQLFSSSTEAFTNLQSAVTSPPIITPEEILLYKMFTYCLEQNSKSVVLNNTSTFNSVFSTYERTLLVASKTGEEQVPPHKFRLLKEAIVTLATILGSMTTNLEYSKFLAGVNPSWIDLIIQELQAVSDPPFNYVCELLRITGNVTYRSVEYQDHIRLNGGIEQLMNHCHNRNHTTQPFQREWAIVALRHCCEGNVENQTYIDSLKPQNLDLPEDMPPELKEHILNRTLNKESS